MLRPFTFLFAYCLLAFPYHTHAEDNSAYKALVLFQTLKLIDWDTRKTVNQKLNFCSLTQNEYSAAHTLARKQLIKSGQHLVYFHHFYHLEDLTDFNLEFGCDIYYFDNVFSQLNLRSHLATAVQQNSLTIGNGDTFLMQNASMAFIEQSNKTILQVNPHQTVIKINQNLALLLDVAE